MPRSSARRHRVAVTVLFAVLLLGSACRGGMERLSTHVLPAPVPTTAPAVTATWFGTAAVLLSDGTTRILIDPFVTREGILTVGLGREIRPDDALVAEWIDRVGAQGSDLVLVSHSHYDHAMDAPLFAKRTGATLVGSESTANIGRGLGLPEERIRTIESGAPVTAGAFRVRMLESRHGPALFGRIPYPGTVDAPLHPPAPAKAYRLGTAYSIVVEHPLGTIVHHGSAGWVEGMFDAVTADVVMLGLAGRDDTAAYLEHVVGAVGADRVVPVHWDDFFQSLDEPLRPLINVDVPEFFEVVDAADGRWQIEVLPLAEPRILLGGPGRK